MFSPHTITLHDTLNDVAGISSLMSSGVFGDLSDDVVVAVLEEAGKFAATEIAPMNSTGDQHGCVLDADTHAVSTAPGWKSTYQKWCEAGWASLPCDETFGGQGLPTMVSLAVQELWNTASNAYGIGTLLTQGAVEAIEAHGSAHLQQLYLPKMVAGDWTGTMNLTEPQAGSDLSGVRSTAKALDDGRYAITGTKIYITYGEHDLTENIVHLVLARLPDAPDGIRGISMFLVPKFLPDDAGNPGKRNDVKCIGLEHKLGIHASPTCTMRFGDDGGAIGWLVGEQGRGLNCMFTMMNNARLHVGMQGVAIAERAYQQALAYAHERRQGRKKGDTEAMLIIEHPDVRRMLMDMKARTQAARSICFLTARAIDLSRVAASDEERADNSDLATLLTPVAKAFSTDMGVEVASDGVQVHGGMGYIEETGAAQHLRDARITPIYEGTNGIQALDLVTRKVSMRGGEVVAKLIGEMRETASALGAEADQLTQAIGLLETESDRIRDWLAREDERAIAVATPFLRMFGLTLGGFGLAKAALAARGRNAPDAETGAQLLAYFSAMQLPQVAGLAVMVRDGSNAVIAVTPEALAVR